MNRFKKEIRKRGVKLECDYEFLPCDGVETVEADAENASVRIYHNSAGWMNIRFGRDMSEVVA